MNRIVILTLLVIGLCAALLAAGCQAQATPKSQPTPTDNVVVLVVTATAAPTLAATVVSEPTITPLATFTPIGTMEATATASATATATRKPLAVKSSTPKPLRTNTAIPPAAAASPTSAPSQNLFPAPQAISPTGGDSNSDGHDIQFKFAAVGPLGGNQCYLLWVQLANEATKTVAGDAFLDVAHCGNQSAAGKILSYTLFRPTFHNAPTYGAIEYNAQKNGRSDTLKLEWYVRVVQNNGLNPDGVHYNTTPLGPNSGTLESDFQS